MADESLRLRLAEATADSAIRERDETKVELDAALAKADALKADAQHWEGKAAGLGNAVRAVVNDPLMPREQVQSRLLVALERFDK